MEQNISDIVTKAQVNPMNVSNLYMCIPNFLLDLLEGVATKDESETHDNALTGTGRVAVIELVHAVGNSREAGKVHLITIEKGQVHCGVTEILCGILTVVS